MGHGEPMREVVIGKNSAVWATLSADEAIASRFPIALSHRDVAAFAFHPDDRVWILSYARDRAANEALFAPIAAAGVREAIYVSSATTNIAADVRCYAYPRAKRQAEQAARASLDARILTIGLMHERPDTLPGGTSIATGYDRLRSFLLAPHWPPERASPTLLFTRVDRPFANGWERAAYGGYGRLIALCGKWPCALRPVDLVLRGLGWNWYGYLFLSNRKWISTTSS